MAVQMLKIFLVSLLAASGARVRPQDALATSTLPEDWAEKKQYVCMQKEFENKLAARVFENKFCLVKYDNELAGVTEKFADDIEACAKGQNMRLCDLKEEGGDLRVSYKSRRDYGPVAKSCFRWTISTSPFAVIEAAVDARTCEERTGGEIGEALTTTTTSTTTTEEVAPEPEIDEEAEKKKTVDALSLFSAEGYWELGDKKIKCCVSSAGGKTHMQDINAKKPHLGAIRVMGDTTGCGYMFGDTYHSVTKTEFTCVATVGEIMEASGSDLAAILELGLPEVVPPEPEPKVEETDDTLAEEHY